MKRISTIGAKILERMTEGLLPLSEDGAEARKIGKKGGAFMQVVIERLDTWTFSVAHYYEQNGDLMRDPEMTFCHAVDGHWYATSFRQDSVGVDQRSADYRSDTGGFQVYERMQGAHTTFANKWLRNIKAQHPEFFAKAAKAAASVST